VPWQASGVAVADACVTTFNELKLKHSMKFIIYGMDEAMKEIQVLIRSVVGSAF